MHRARGQVQKQICSSVWSTCSYFISEETKSAMSENDTLAEKVASLCYMAYNGLPKTGKPSRDCEWTLLSAILLEDLVNGM